MHHFLKSLNSCLNADISMFLAILLYAVVHCLYTGLSQVVHFIGAKPIKSVYLCLVVLLLFYSCCFFGCLLIQQLLHKDSSIKFLVAGQGRFFDDYRSAQKIHSVPQGGLVLCQDLHAPKT